MSMTEGQTYRCQNRLCNCEVVVTKPSAEGLWNPRCCCGAEMKKPYASPTLRELTSEVVVAHSFHER
jgi:hypothetical protein